MVTRSLHTRLVTPRLSARAALRLAWVRVDAMLRARTTRQLLTEMEPRMLADIGIGRGDALHEANRPFWDV